MALAKVLWFSIPSQRHCLPAALPCSSRAAGWDFGALAWQWLELMSTEKRSSEDTAERSRGTLAAHPSVPWAGCTSWPRCWAQECL